ncbi:androgen-induced gene 1 protein-like isoform X2 [Ruditapes philippinarum]|uniref:androgen-induced gene 1 protein-like isoform X2 n=1 Tax=Ruditapes philippinarum TaxID=129788 RepID=UPI00295BF057|nr:androgen-induced gene 1 protein-like isoform X2 [Ruditapes philippinarum]
MDYACLIVHSILFAIHVFSVWYNVRYVGDTLQPFYDLFTYKGYAGKFKYLTFISFLIQTFYFGLAVVNDIWGSNVRPSDKKGKKTRLQSFMNTFLAAVVYPVGTFVVMTFWGIYAVDRELVFPKRLDKIIPVWLNHIEHTTVLPILLLEKCLVYHEYPSRKKGLGILMGFANSYLIWILWIAFYADIWVYPVLQVMEGHQRVIFITILMAFFMSIYILGESLNRFIWRKEIAASAAKQRQKKQT